MNRRTLKKYLIKTTVIISLFLCFYGSLPVITFAQETGTLEDYTVLTQLPGTTDASGKTTLAQYLPGMFNLILGVSAVLAFVMITYAGIQYMTTDAVFKKAEARSTLNGALGGLLLVLASYAILYTINPKILEFNLNIRRIDNTRFPSVSGASSVGTGSTHSYTNSSGSTVYYNDCANPCTLVSSGGLNLPSTGGIYSETGIPPRVNTEFGTKLSNLNTALQNSSVDWAITEAWPPTVNHLQPCHRVGTCVDARPEEPQTPASIIRFEELSRSSGLYVEYEVQNEVQRQNLIDAGYTGTVIVVSGINNSHFSVYSDRQTKTP